MQQFTWQQFRQSIKNKKFIHEGKTVTGWELPMNKQTRMYSDIISKRNARESYINSGVRNV